MNVGYLIDCIKLILRTDILRHSKLRQESIPVGYLNMSGGVRIPVK